MEIDMKKLETAIIYLQRIADGNNPVNNMPAEDDAVLNNPNVIRCMYFVKEVLEEVQKNGGKIGRVRRDRMKGRAKEVFPFEVLAKFRYREDKSINKLLQQIYEPAPTEIKRLSGKTVNEWLMASGYVEEVFNDELKKNIKVPTDKGLDIGLRSERVDMVNNVGVFYTIVYNKNAQEFLVRNLEKFINGEVVE